MYTYIPVYFYPYLEIANIVIWIKGGMKMLLNCPFLSYSMKLIYCAYFRLSFS